MTESIWKRFNQQDSSLSKLLIRDESDLNFSKWFTYKDQNLDNVHNSADEMKEINRTKLEGYIWEKIPTKQMTDEEISTYFNWLTDQQARWIWNKAKTNEYDQNTLVSYVNHWDEWVNPYAEWTWMYEKKTNATNNEKSSNLWKWAAWIWWLEVLGKARSIVWEYLLKKTLDKYLPEDISRLIRDARYEEVPGILSKELKNTEWEIAKAETRLNKIKWNRLVNAWVNEEIRLNLEELYARRDSIKETISSMNETKKNLPGEKPKTAAQTANDVKWMYWSDLNAAKNTAVDAQVYYTKEIAPIYKQTKTRFSIPEILWELKKSDFPWKTEWQWKEIQEMISKEIEAYADYVDISAEELHNKLDDFNLDKEAIKWEDPKWITSAFKKAAYTKINNAIDEAIEAELPWRWIKNKRIEYNNRLNLVKEFWDYAVEWWKRKPEQWIIKDIIDAIKSPTVKRTIWQWFKKSWEAIRPYNYTIKPIINLIKKTKNQVSTTAKKIEEKASEIIQKTKWWVNTIAKDFKQPKLFWWDPIGTLQLFEWLWALWDSVLWWWTTVWEVSNAIWQIPWIKAANAMDDVLRTSYEWSLLREEDKPLYMKEILEEVYPWETYSLEEAEEMYRILKENWKIYLQPHIEA